MKNDSLREHDVNTNSIQFEPQFKIKQQVTKKCLTSTVDDSENYHSSEITTNTWPVNLNQQETYSF